MKGFRMAGVLAAALLVANAADARPTRPAPPPPPKPAPPPKPTPPTNPTPGGDFVQCVADGNSVQFCMAQYGG